MIIPHLIITMLPLLILFAQGYCSTICDINQSQLVPASQLADCFRKLPVRFYFFCNSKIFNSFILFLLN